VGTIQTPIAEKKKKRTERKGRSVLYSAFTVVQRENKTKKATQNVNTRQGDVQNGDTLFALPGLARIPIPMAKRPNTRRKKEKEGYYNNTAQHQQQVSYLHRPYGKKKQQTHAKR